MSGDAEQDHEQDAFDAHPPRDVDALLAALSESEARFRRLADSMPLLVWMSDARGRRMHVNHHWTEFTGCAIESALGDGWTSCLHEDDLPRWRLGFEAAMAAREPFRIDYRLRDAAGELRWIHEHAVPRLLGERFSGFVASCVDITEHRRMRMTLEEARSQLALVVSHLPVVIYTCDPHDFRTTYVSPNVAEITGFDADDLYADPRLWIDRIHPDDREAALTSCAEMQRLPFRESEYRWRRADGNYAWFLDVVRLVRAEGGAPSHHAGVLLDISARRLVEDELRATREMARTLTARLIDVREEEQRRLSRELHDELGANLTAVRLDLEGVKRRIAGSDAETRRRLDRALTGVDATLDAVRGIAQQLRPSVLDKLGLQAALEVLVEQFRERTSLDISLSIEIDTNGLDDARATCIFRIAQEALTNVARHARARTVQARLECLDGHLALLVEDDGQGIDAEQLERADSLGLAGLRERARLLGGMAVITRAERGGTRVDVRIPVA